jgi:hypothetical protein
VSKETPYTAKRDQYIAKRDLLDIGRPESLKVLAIAFQVCASVKRDLIHSQKRPESLKVLAMAFETILPQVKAVHTRELRCACRPTLDHGFI